MIMNVKAKDLSPEQKTAIEGLLGRAIAEDEAVSVRATAAGSAPEWLRASWDSAKRLSVDQLSEQEIEAEIREARRASIRSAQPAER
jgi:hypothetical protein